MPIPTDTLRDMNGLNRWFAVSCVLLLASLVWMIWEDYDRPWRGFQDDYMVAQATLAHLDYLQTQTEAYQNEIDQAEISLEQAEQERKENLSKRAELELNLAELKVEHDGLKIQFGNADAIVQVTRVEYEEALTHYGEDHDHTKHVWRKLQNEEKEVAELKLAKDKVEDQQKEIRNQVKAIDQSVIDAQKALDSLNKVVSDAQLKEDRYSNVLTKAVINAPLMDFTAPKGTESRHEVKQYVLPEVRQELNYLQTYTTDRCTTCHVSIDNKNFSRQNLARTFERSLPAINEELKRLKQQPIEFPAVPELDMEYPPDIERGQVTEFWTLFTKGQQKAYFNELLDRVNTYLDRTDKKEMKLRQPLIAHPNLDLFVHVDSTHPSVQIGCTVCHEGNPQETDFRAGRPLTGDP